MCVSAVPAPRSASSGLSFILSKLLLSFREIYLKSVLSHNINCEPLRISPTTRYQETEGLAGHCFKMEITWSYASAPIPFHIGLTLRDFMGLSPGCWLVPWMSAKKVSVRSPAHFALAPEA